MAGGKVFTGNNPWNGLLHREAVNVEVVKLGGVADEGGEGDACSGYCSH